MFGLVVYWCVRFLFSFPLLCASAFYSLRLPTEYERNGRYEGSRWGKWFLLKIFYRYLLHFCGRGNTSRLFCVISLFHVGLLGAGSSLRSGSVCADARRPREGAAAARPPAHRPTPSRSCHRLGVKLPFLLPAPPEARESVAALSTCEYSWPSSGLEEGKQNIQENVLFSFFGLATWLVGS